jgi:hypothetical protein
MNSLGSKLYFVLIVLVALTAIAHVLLISFVNKDPTETMVLIDNIITWSLLGLAFVIVTMNMTILRSGLQNTHAKRDALLAMVLLGANAVVQQWVDERNAAMRIVALVTVFYFVIMHSQQSNV